MPLKIVEMHGTNCYVHDPTASDALGIYNAQEVPADQSGPSPADGWRLTLWRAPTSAEVQAKVTEVEAQGYTYDGRDGTPGVTRVTLYFR